MIAVETPQGSVDAKLSTDGTYRLSAPWAEKPGRYDLIFAVARSGGADVLTITLEIPSVGASTSAPFNGLSASAMAGGLKDRLSSNNSGVLVFAIVAFMRVGFGGLVLARRRRTVLVAAVGFVVLQSHKLPTRTKEKITAHRNHPPVRCARHRAGAIRRQRNLLPKSTQRILAIRTVVTSPPFIAARSSSPAALYRLPRQACER